jgi:hypothetical protein
MLKQYEKTYTYDGSGGPYNYPADWFPMNCADYDTVAITITASTGFDGTLSFWGGAGADFESPALWGLNDASDASSLVTQVTSSVGATPSAYAQNFRGSVAGLAEFGVYFANPSTYVSVVGTVTIKVGFYSSAK